MALKRKTHLRTGGHKSKALEEIERDVELAGIHVRVPINQYWKLKNYLYSKNMTITQWFRLKIKQIEVKPLEDKG